MKKHLLISLLIVLIFVIGCSEKLTSDSLSAEASTSSEKKIELNEKKVPIPQLTTLDKNIEVVQSSYCWGALGCKNYTGGAKMVHGKNITPLKPGTKIKVSYKTNPSPNEIVVNKISSTDSTKEIINLKANEFIVPTKQGIYYYELQASWTDKEKKYSIGDTSSVFAIKVK